MLPNRPSFLGALGARRHCLALVFSLACALASATPPERFVIPFEYEAGYLIVDVVLEDRLPLKFIFDTGSRLSILTDPTLAAVLGRPPGERIRILGSDRSAPIEGRLLRRCTIDVGELRLRSQALIVLSEGTIDLPALTGRDVYGVLGVEAFGAYAITIDYAREQLTLERPHRVRVRRKTSVHAIDVDRSRVLLPVFTKVHAGYADTLNLLLDTGAGVELMLSYLAGDTTLLPDRLSPGEIATGLGGKVLGVIGRSDTVLLGDYAFPALLTHFQVVPTDADELGRGLSRDGVIGNGFLERFTVTIDFPNQRLLLRPRRRFQLPQRFDRSGAQLIAQGPELEQIGVLRVTEGSPADLAGLRGGDIITRAGILPARLRGLEGVRRLLRSREGKRIRLTVLRGDEVVPIEFRLRRLI